MLIPYILVMVTVSTLSVGVYAVFATPLQKDSPTGNASDQIDLSVNPNEVLPANGTMILSTLGINDIDITAPIPEGTTVILESDEVTITNKEVSVP